jgi:transcription elongation GreA/GreB family factor
VVPLPTIILIASDYPRLEKLARIAAQRGETDAMFLLNEINRAIIVPDDDPDVASIVTMGSWVTYWRNWGNRQRTVQLVWPEDRTLDLVQVSVLSGLGSALLGLRVGDQMPYFVARYMNVVRVKSVTRPDSKVVTLFGGRSGRSNHTPNDDPGPAAA